MLVVLGVLEQRHAAVLEMLVDRASTSRSCPHQMEPGGRGGGRGDASGASGVEAENDRPPARAGGCSGAGTVVDLPGAGAEWADRSEGPQAEAVGRQAFPPEQVGPYPYVPQRVQDGRELVGVSEFAPWGVVAPARR